MRRQTSALLFAAVAATALWLFAGRGNAPAHGHSAVDANTVAELARRVASLEAELRAERAASAVASVGGGGGGAHRSVLAVGRKRRGSPLPEPKEVCGFRDSHGNKIHCKQPGVTPVAGHPTLPDLVGVDRSKIPNPFGDSEPPCDVPVYTIDRWKRDHPGEMPDHPCVFAAEPKTGFQAMKDYPNLGALLRDFGNETVATQPGYTQAGGHFHYAAPHSRVGDVWKLRDLAASWNDTHLGHYYSEFNCKTAFCQRFIDKVSLPEYFVADSRASTNFLVGGPGSGLPFHRHEQTFQMLVNGRKAWFLVPPGPVANELADVIGPFVFPPDGFDAAVRGKPVGQRPLRCVQYPGEIMWLPPQWWHATMNLADATVAYGQKPRYTGRKEQSPESDVHRRVSKKFPKLGEGDVFWWYSVQKQISDAKHDPSNAGSIFAGVLKKFRAALERTPDEDARIMRDTAAFAHCFFAENLISIAGDSKGNSALAEQWTGIARQLSPEIHRLQCLKEGRVVKDHG